MSLNKQARVVLCYGDSNTWGRCDDKRIRERSASNVRWTGILQESLGKDYKIIEEGLNSRTTNLEHYDVNRRGRNGLTYFVPCLLSHAPIELVIIMLGTNDLKLPFQRSVDDIANTLRLYIAEVKLNVPDAGVLLISPIHIDHEAADFVEYYGDVYDKERAENSKLLGKRIEKTAAEEGSLFFDASSVAKAGKDGVHLDAVSHRALAHSLERIVRKI